MPLLLISAMVGTYPRNKEGRGGKRGRKGSGEARGCEESGGKGREGKGREGKGRRWNRTIIVIGTNAFGRTDNACSIDRSQLKPSESTQLE